MPSRPPSPAADPSSWSAPAADARAWRAALIFVGLLTLVRVVGLFLSPVELYPEEAQYWLWSRHLALGYFSKPPMIAWVIRAATLGSNAEPFVRLAAPLAHAMAGLALARAGARLYGGWVGFWAAVIYLLAPGVQLSSAVIATDCLVMMFAGLSLFAYASWFTARTAGARHGWAAMLGLWLGLGALSKYAIVYIALGLLLHAAVSKAARARWRAVDVALTVAVALVVLSPNLAWNAAHGFQTVAHTAHDADWGGKAHAAPSPSRPVAAAHPRHADLMNARHAPGFLLAQLGTFGPVPFIVLLIGTARAFLPAVRRRRTASETQADGLLGALAAPALVLILAESLIARANANWAAVAYVPAALLVAAWFVRWRAWGWLALAIAPEALIVPVFLAAGVSPAFADRIGLANSFKRARGWEATAALVERAEAKLGPSTLSAVAVDDRFTFNALAYYGRDAFRTGPPLRMWVREIRPGNEAETDDALEPGSARVLFVDVGGAYRAEAMRDFARVTPLGAWKVWTDPRHFREVTLFLGQDYRRRPRDPSTGLPVPA